jgi:predicted permease
MATSTMRWRRKFAIGMAAYGILVVAAATLVEVTHPERWVAVLLAVPPVAAVVYALGVQARGIRRGEGIERSAYVESSSIAFVATMLSALTYGFLESWAGAPRLSAFWFWFYGMALWSVVGALWKRGYR